LAREPGCVSLCAGNVSAEFEEGPFIAGVKQVGVRSEAVKRSKSVGLEEAFWFDDWSERQAGLSMALRSSMPVVGEPAGIRMRDP
jgi:hypothetical protein